MVRKLWLAFSLLFFTVFGLSQTRIISHVTRSGGGFTTAVQIQNLTVLSQNVLLSPFDTDGSPMESVGVSIDAGDVLQTSSVELFGGDVSHFLIEADDRVKVSVVYDFERIGAPAQVPESSQTASSWRLFPGDWSQVWDGFAIVNRGDEATELWVAQKDFAGNVLQTVRAAEALAAGGKALFVIGSPSGSPFIADVTGTYFEVSASQMTSITALRGTLSGSDLAVLWSNEATAMSGSISKRDSTGVWFIEGGSLYDVTEMMGYNVAHDRLWQADLNRRTGLGTLSEVLGPLTIAADQILRLTLPSREEFWQMYNDLDEETRTVFKAYADGINRWVGQVNSDPDNIPFEYRALGITRVEPWTPIDIMGYVMFLERNFSNNALGARQLLNLNLALDLINAAGGDLQIASHMFDDIRWVDDPQTPTFIDGKGPQKRTKSVSTDFRKADLSKLNNLDGVKKFVNDLSETKALLKEIGAFIKGGSYGWVIAPQKSATGNAILYGGPQIGFDAPAPPVEGSIESESLTVSGMTVPGIPVFLVGRTPYHSWTFEVGHAHIWDFYFEEPEDVYLKRVEKIQVRGGGTVDMNIFYGNHGPLTSQDPQLTWKYALDGFEFNFSGGILAMQRAKSIDEFNDGVKNLGISVHVLYADVKGNIGYWMAGRTPVRPEGNWRFPQGFLPPLEWDKNVIEEIVHDRNHPRGWYAGWNNQASSEVPDPTATFGFGPFHRSHIIQDYMEQNDQITWEDSKDLARKISLTFNTMEGGNAWSVMERFYKPIIMKNLTPERENALAILENWDHTFPAGTDADWFSTPDMDEGWMLERQWIVESVNLIFGNEIGNAATFLDAEFMFGTILHALDPESGITNFYNWPSSPEKPDATYEDAIVEALDRALAQLGERPWGVGDRPITAYGHQLLGIVYTSHFLNQATYAQAVELGPEGPVRIESIFPLGNDGTILLDSQRGLPVTRGGTALIRLPLTREDVSPEDPFFNMTELFETMQLRPFPLFGQPHN